MNSPKSNISKVTDTVQSTVDNKTNEIFKDLELKLDIFMQRDPSLTPEWKESVLVSLNDPEVKKVLLLFFEHQVIGWTLLNGGIWLPASVAVSGPILGPLISEGVRGAVKYLFTKKRMKDYNGKNILSVGCATPMPGTFFPLLYLYKKHPELVEYIYLYLYMTPLLNLIENKDSDPSSIVDNVKRKVSLQMMNIYMYTKVIKNIVLDFLVPAYYNYLEIDINNLKSLYKGLDPHDLESMNILYDLRLDSGKFLIKVREYLRNVFASKTD